MAPRRRTQKRGSQTRMDAALDAMRPYGFPRNLVRRTVGELLKVYGGNEGWVFIEDAAYTLLIETMLEKQNNAPPEGQDGLNEDDSRNFDRTVAVVPAGSSSSVLVDAESHTNETIYHLPDCGDCDSRHPGRSMGLNESDEEIDPRNIAVCESAERLPHSLTVTNCPEPPKPVESVGQRKRKPCYGWISDDDDQDDIIHLTPPPPPFTH